MLAQLGKIIMNDAKYRWVLSIWKGLRDSKRAYSQPLLFVLQVCYKSTVELLKHYLPINFTQLTNKSTAEHTKNRRLREKAGC